LKVGLALGGGVSRGFFHIGVIKALEKMKIKINVVSGTSVGAVIGGIYTLQPEAKALEERVYSIIQKHQKELLPLKDIFAPTNIEAKTLFFEKCLGLVKEFYIWNLRIIKPSLADFKTFFRIFKDLFKDFSFADCKLPFYATGVDVAKGEVVCLNEGHLSMAALASSAYPGFFPPIKWGDRILIDGGVLMPIPAKVIREKVDFIIGINLESSGYYFPPIRSAMDVMNIADRIRYKKIIEDSLEGIDFLLAPDLESFPWGDFSKCLELVKKGEEQVYIYEKELLRALKNKRIKKFFFLSRRGTA
jgi:NTE family protein